MAKAAEITAGIVRAPNVMEVHPSVPARSVTEFINFARANPGKISMASAGIGTPAHVAGELFKMMAGVDPVHVPYRGAAPALNDLLGGHMQVQFDALPSSIEHIKGGKLRALAVTTTARSGALPDGPTVGEFVAGYEATVQLRTLIGPMIRVQGIAVGSRAAFEAMNRAISANDLKPVIDSTFPLAEAAPAFRHMQAGAHFGKIAVTV